MTEHELYWLAGLLEGEGSFLKGPPSSPNQPVLTLSMTDQDVIARVAGLLGLRYAKNRARLSHWKPYFSIHQRGLPAVRMMQRLRPLMGQRRREQIDAAVSSYEYRAGRKINFTIAEGIREIYRAGNVTLKQLAADRELAVSTVSKIVNMRLWKPEDHMAPSSNG